ncbi:MAG TPA: M23 family metallopeptidase [Acidimicrobiia bacterium]|nr:M23 family metallopeptidase [Acidimicrobiia bacterium]
MNAPTGFPLPPTLPADATAVPLTWLTGAQTTGGPVTSKLGVLQTLSATRTAVLKAQQAVRDAAASVAESSRHLDDVRARQSDLENARQLLVQRVRARAVAIYMDGGTSLVPLVSDATQDAGRRAKYANAADDLDIGRLAAVMQQQVEARADFDAGTRALARGNADLATARQRLTFAFATLVAVQAAVTDPAHGGRVFPVDGAYDFVDSWNALRAHGGDGTKEHHATDIMAKRATPVVAIESGTVFKLGWNTLGGWRLWIKGASGAQYYYAHLMAYAPHLRNGSRIRAGQYLGRVGNTGDAKGGPPHLHFEVHLSGVTVNPYPLLCLLAGAVVPAIPPAEATPPRDQTP